MNAILNFKVIVNGNDVLVNMDVEKTKDVDIVFLQQTLKILADASKKIKANAEKFVSDFEEEATHENNTTGGDSTETFDAPEELEEREEIIEDNIINQII